MMTRKLRLPPLWLTFAAAIAFLLPARPDCAQNGPKNALSGTPVTASPAQTPSASPALLAPAKAAPAAPAKPANSATLPPNRAQAYYHLSLASTYENEAVTEGRTDLVTQAIEEYKLALNADPASSQLNNALADLYFRVGRISEAESVARELLKRAPDDLDAHKLLGRVYLRTLSEGQNAASPASPASNVLDRAIAEFEKIVALEPRSVDERMVLGQLYTVKHDAKKAEEQFKTAKAIEPDSEEVVLNLARLYAESGDYDHAAKEIESVAVADRTAKMEAALGAAYDQLKRPKEAIAAYQRAIDMEPGDLRTLDALAQALLERQPARRGAQAVQKAGRG